MVRMEWYLLLQVLVVLFVARNRMSKVAWNQPKRRRCTGRPRKRSLFRASTRNLSKAKGNDMYYTNTGTSVYTHVHQDMDQLHFHHDILLVSRIQFQALDHAIHLFIPDYDLTIHGYNTWHYKMTTMSNVYHLHYYFYLTYTRCQLINFKNSSPC